MKKKESRAISKKDKKKYEYKEYFIPSKGKLVREKVEVK